MPDVQVTKNEQQSWYEATIDGERAGFAAYELRGDDTIVFTHTEVDPAYEGHGVGGRLARTALDDVRDEGTRSVVPACPFIKAWIDKHPGYAALVDGEADHR